MEAKPLYSTRKLLLPAIFVLGLFWVTWNRRPSTTAYYGQAMGTTWSVQLVDSPTGNVQEIIQTELLSMPRCQHTNQTLKSVVLTVMIQNHLIFQVTRHSSFKLHSTCIKRAYKHWISPLDRSSMHGDLGSRHR